MGTLRAKWKTHQYKPVTGEDLYAGINADGIYTLALTDPKAIAES